MDRDIRIVNRLPLYMQDGPKLRVVISSISQEIDLLGDRITTVDNLIDVHTTTGSDIDNVWGKLLNAPRMDGETDTAYQDRLALVIPSLSGGTAGAMRNAVALIYGIDKIDDISVIDAWDYTGDISDVDKTVGNSLCIIDLRRNPYNSIIDIRQRIIDALEVNKAAGVSVRLIFENFILGAYATYGDFSTLRYIDLASIPYQDLG